jgi:hypothetical protein
MRQCSYDVTSADMRAYRHMSKQRSQVLQILQIAVMTADASNKHARYSDARKTEASRVFYTNRFNFSKHSLHKVGQIH